MEHTGSVPNRIFGTLHTAKDRSGSRSSRAYTWPFNRPNYFIINLALGGTLGGNIDDNIFNNPLLMKVDWVRVYQRDEVE